MGHETHESRTVTWLGTDDPQRADTATINLEPERLSAHGASRTADYAASWSLTTTGNWFTENLTVSVHGQGWSRYLMLDRATDGSRGGTKVSGDTDMPEPGIVDPASLTGAVDCDLGLCPATNTMPILRLGLVDDAEAAAELTVAWVEMPSLRCRPATDLQRLPRVRRRHRHCRCHLQFRRLQRRDGGGLRRHRDRLPRLGHPPPGLTDAS